MNIDSRPIPVLTWPLPPCCCLPRRKRKTINYSALLGEDGEEDVPTDPAATGAARGRGRRRTGAAGTASQPLAAAVATVAAPGTHFQPSALLTPLQPAQAAAPLAPASPVTADALARALQDPRLYQPALTGVLDEPTLQRVALAVARAEAEAHAAANYAAAAASAAAAGSGQLGNVNGGAMPGYGGDAAAYAQALEAAALQGALFASANPFCHISVLCRL